MKRFKVWFLETRPQFLTLSVVLAFLGTAIAWYDGYFNLWHALLAGIGLVLTHASVNILNDYFDFRSGIDLATKRTPFSGGSGILPAGLLTPRQVLWLGMVALLLAVPIGIYFVVIARLAAAAAARRGGLFYPALQPCYPQAPLAGVGRRGRPRRLAHTGHVLCPGRRLHL